MKDSIKYSIITMIFLFGYKNSFGQKMNKNYMLFSKSDEYTEYLEFKNDSIVTRKPHLIKCGVRITESKNEESNIYRDYQYEKHENKITIYNFDKSNDLILRNSDTDYFINEHFGFLYVLRNLFDEFPDLAMKLEKEIFWLDSPKTSCGIVRKKRKEKPKVFSNY